MSDGGKGRVWWWLLLVVVLMGLGYYIYSEMGPEPGKGLVSKKVSPVETKAPTQELPRIAEEKNDILAGVTEEEPAPKASPPVDYCTQVEKNVAEFFHYLDQKNYVRHLDPEMDTYARFKEILKGLTARPPVPAGEGIDPKMIVGNVYHFFRVLGRKDLRLIREVIRNERDTMEINLDMFYRWLNLGNRCPDPEGLRPSMKALYQYAGFLINTIGGRTYLSRRPADLRLLVSYYCLLVLHEADKIGKNNYGIDIFPYLAPLKREIGHYPDFQFQQEYIARLNRIEGHYLQNR